MAQPISHFFQRLGFPLKNVRWSWGARNEAVVLLRTWEDHYAFKKKEVAVLQDSWFEVNESYGLDERVNHLKSIWNGEVSAYTVMASVRDSSAIPREIKDYRDDAVFFIQKLHQSEGGDLVAFLSDLVPVNNLMQHSVTHRTEANSDVFPVDSKRISHASTEGYKEKIPKIREFLIEIFHKKTVATYSEVMDRFGLTYFPLVAAMGVLGRECQSAGHPIITAVIVDKETRTCSDGIRLEFDVQDDQKERDRCYEHWKSEDFALPLAPTPESADPDSSDFGELLKRFAQVETRPQQGKFRELVFKSCAGKCIVSGCDIPEALDAAHLEGRDWRLGHNQAADGVLLRRDLHALYDKGLLKFDEDGRVKLDANVLEHYAEFQDTLTTIRSRINLHS